MSSTYMTTVAGGMNQQHAMPGGNLLAYSAIPGSFGEPTMMGGRRRRRRSSRKTHKAANKRNKYSGTRRRRRYKGGDCPCTKVGGNSKTMSGKIGGNGVNFQGQIDYT